MTIIERPRKDGTTGWQVILRPRGGKTIVKTFGDRESADMFKQMTGQEMAATRLRKALAARTMKGVEPIVLKAVIPDAALDPNLAQGNYDNELLSKTLADYRKCSECKSKSFHAIATIQKAIGEVKLGELKKRWVKQFIAHMRMVPTQFGKPYAHSTIQGYISVINCAVRWRAEEFDLNPVTIPFNKRTMFPRNCENMRTRRLERDERLALFATLRNMQGPSSRHYRLLMRLALETGARLQEMVLSNWSEFDLSKGTWSIPAEHVKTGCGRFTPLTPRARRVLRQLWAMRDRTNPRVFHLLGQADTVSTVFARMVRRAGLSDFHFHDLRHEAITQLVLKQRELTVNMIMTMVGHSSLAMLRRYTNLRPEELVARLR